MENPARTVTIERSEYELMQAKIAELGTLLEWYKSQLLSANRVRFGTSSERTDIDPNQLSIFGEPETSPPPEDETEEIACKRKKRKGKREEDLSALPAERIDYRLPESERVCPECGETMRDIGADIRRELKLIPAKVVVLEHATRDTRLRLSELRKERNVNAVRQSDGAGGIDSRLPCVTLARRSHRHVYPETK